MTTKLKYKELTVHHTSVFSNGAGGGNPCPVIISDRDISSEQGMWLARYFAAETIIILPATRDEANYRIRYFVPKHEMEMCIHGTIAATAILEERYRSIPNPIIFQTLLGSIKVEWKNDGKKIQVTVNQFPAKVSETAPSKSEIALALGLLHSENYINDLLPIKSVSTSRYKLIVPLDSEETLNKLTPNFEELWSLCDRYNTTGFYPFAITSEEGTFAARQFPNNAGYNEDPATGVAACSLGAYLAQFSNTQNGWHSYKILQGYAMGRPSKIYVDVYLEEGKAIQVRVNGSVNIEKTENVSIPLKL